MNAGPVAALPNRNLFSAKTLEFDSLPLRQLAASGRGNYS